MLAALLAFAAQSFVTQTHIHFEARAASAANPAPRAQAARDQAPFDSPANCPLCQELAHAGHYLLPAPVAFYAPAPPPVWHSATPILALTLRQRSHAWQSRAPPIVFQA